MNNLELKLKGMHCKSCEDLINEHLNNLNGVKAKANYKKNVVNLEFDENIISLKEIRKTLKQLGYDILDNNQSFTYISYIKIALIILGLNYIVVTLTGLNILQLIYTLVNNVPTIDNNASLLILFTVGVFTSFHCVAMCGGINIAQCMAFDKTKNKFLNPNIMYNLGRVTSYTILGGIVGAIGSVLTISLDAQATLSIVIGLFMVLMGINLAGFNFFRKLIPTMPKIFTNINKSDKGPYIVGLINGFMPCGPLQSMQLYALSTGSFISGALSMFVFSIGTVPVMYIFGMVGSFNNSKFSSKIMKISAILVIVLGFTMITRGASILGYMKVAVDENEIVSTSVEEEVQNIYTELEPYSYPTIKVKKGIPVKWVINATESNLNGCNNEIIIREYGIQKPLVLGENIIEFTPTTEGEFIYSCWMGMIVSTILVTN